MSIQWSLAALDDLDRLRTYIAEANPTAAQRIAGHILHHIEVILRDNPEIGRPGRVADTRELVVSGTPFIVPYRVKGATLEILRIYHSTQRWPEVF